MGKVEQHDLSEYHIYAPALSLNGDETVAFIPIPQSGQVKRAVLCMDVAQTTGACSISFELGGVLMKSGGSVGTITIGATDAIGICQAIAFDGQDKVNYAREAIDGEQGIGSATTSVLEIVSSAGGAAGVASFVITIGR